MNWDAIVIGAGVNGLTAAAYLAKSGRKVLVLERRDRTGGLAASEEFHPGYKTRGLLLDTSGVQRRAVEELGLRRHGLEFLAEERPVFCPQEDGPGLLLYRDPSRMDVLRYAEFRAFITRLKPLARRVLEERPPAILPERPGDLWKLLATGLALRRLGSKGMLEALRVGPMCAADWLNEWFSDELLKAALAAPALWGTYAGPWSAGTVATLLLRECAAEPEIKGGPAALARALEAAAKAHGADIRTNAPVSRIRLARGEARGVVLAGGEEIPAALVVSSCDPKRTAYDLIAPEELDLELEKQLRVFRTRGVAAKVNLALKGPLEFRSRPGQAFEAVRVGERLDDLERAFDAVKYRRFSEKPMLELRMPSLSEPGLAPPGRHAAEILVHFAPYDLAGGWTEERRRELGDAVLSVLKRHAPGAEELVVARQVLTPADLSEIYGLTGGHLYHGEHGLDQLYALRPSVDCARYSTPVPGLYLAGSGCHPGGGITCGPGRLAAEAILSR